MECSRAWWPGGQRAFALALLVLGARAAAQAHRLNEPLAQAFAGRVSGIAIGASGRVVYQLERSSFDHKIRSAPIDGSSAPIVLSLPETLGELLVGLRLSPDGTRAVFRFLELESHDRLYSVPVDGSQSAVLVSEGGLFEPLTDLLAFDVSADAARVVFVGKSFDMPWELYSAPIDGSSAPVKLSGTLVSGGNVARFVLAAARVIFQADQDTDGVDELWSVPLAGGSSPVKLNPALASGGDVTTSFAVTPDGSTVVYVADQDTNDVFELYAVPSDASAAAVKLSGALVAGGDLTNPQELPIGADGARVVYLADADTDGVTELYSVRLDGSAARVRLNAPLVAGGNVSAGSRISPNALRVVYRADQDVDGVLELFSVPIDGAAPAVQLNGALVAGGSVRAAGTSFAISPDGARVIYVADQLADEVQELFTVPLDGSAPAVRLNGPLVAGGDVALAAIAPDSLRVAYTADEELDGQLRLHVVPLDAGGPSATLDVPSCPADDVATLQFEPGSSRIAYAAGPGGAVPPMELFSVPSAGGAPPLVLSAEPGLVGVTGDVQEFRLSTADRRVVYGATLERSSCGEKELFSVALDGPFHSTLLGGPETSPVLVAAGAGRALFTAQPAGLYCAPLDGSALPLQLASVAAPADVYSVSLAPDGATVLFLARTGGAGPFELYVAAADVALSAYRLSAPLVPNGAVIGYLADPECRFAVYLADQAIDNVFELYLANLDGSGTARRLNGPLASGGSVALPVPTVPSFQISPDGAHVVYLADETSDNVVELYSVALGAAARSRAVSGEGRAGALIRRRLSRTPVAGGDVVSFKISPDGRRVVYQADQDLNDRFELYSVPIGGGAPVKLIPTPVTGGDASSDFQITSDSQRVVYRADQARNDRVELWSVPIEGGTAIRLNASLSGDNDITGFAVAPDGTRVAYFGQQVSQRAELFSVPVAGGAAPVQLSVPFPFRDVFEARVPARGGFVVYHTLTAGVFELFAAPLDGSGAPERVSGLLPTGGQVGGDYQISPDGLRVVYRADELADERFELFLGHLAPPFRRAR